MSTEINLQVEHILLSDLHLAGGQDPTSQHWSRYEQFYFDNVFESFVKHLIAQAQKLDHQVHLVLLGDAFDFLHTPGESGTRRYQSLSEAEALTRLEIIYAGHGQFFKALGWFASAGQRISILPGNHDAALLWPAVQERLNRLILAHRNPGSPGSSFTFYPWFLYLPGILYAEHGQQYHDINAFTTLLEPFADDQSGELEETIGACLDAGLLEMAYNLPADLEFRSEMSGYPLRTFLKHPAGLLASLSIQWHLVTKLLRLLRKRASPVTASRRMNYRKNTLPQFAQRTPFSSTTLESLDRLSQVSNLKMLQRILLRMFQRSRTSPMDHYLYQAAEAISALLDEANQGVPFYIFGHSHLHQQIPLIDEPDYRVVYLNTGSWAVPPFTPPAWAKKRMKFPYVNISQVPGGKHPEAKLLTWNENRQRVEPAT